MSDPLGYHKALWIHQMDQLGEKTIEEVAATAQQYAGADTIYIKVFDGESYMGDTGQQGIGIDKSREAIGSIKKFNEVVQRGAAVGVTVLPWVNPTKHTDGLTHAILAPSAIICDLEPYAGFYQDDPKLIPYYLASLRGGDITQLYVTVDPRPAALAAIGFADWVHLVDGVLPQFYWTDFGQAENPLIPNLEAELKRYGKPVYPAYPYNGAAADLIDAWENARNDGMTGCSLWRMGVAGPAQLQAFQALKLAKPTPLPTNDDYVEIMRLLLGEVGNNYAPDVDGAISYLKKFKKFAA